MSCCARVHTGADAVTSIRDSWEALQHHPNSDFEHFSLVCRLRPEVVQPWALSLWEGARCRAVLAGRIERNRKQPELGYARLPGIEGKELVMLHEGIIGKLDDGDAETLVDAWTQTLDRGDVDFVTLYHLPERYSRLWAAIRCHSGRVVGAASPTWSVHRAMAVEKEPGSLVRKMRSKHRSWIRRKERELEETFPGTVRWNWFREIEDLTSLCERLEVVAQTTYQRGLGAGFINTEETRQRLALFAQRGQMRVCLLECGGQCKAFWLGQLYHGVFYSSATGYTPDLRPFEAGTLMFLRMVDELAREGVSRLDFGLGDAEYKERFADDSWREATVQIFGGTMRGKLLRSYLGASVGVQGVARRILHRMGILGRVKQAWRRRLKE